MGKEQVMDSKTLKAMTWQEFAGLFEVGLDEVDEDTLSVLLKDLAAKFGKSLRQVQADFQSMREKDQAMHYFDYTDGKEIEVSVPINKYVRDLCDRDIWNDQALFEELKEKAIEAHEEWERSNQ